MQKKKSVCVKPFWMIYDETVVFTVSVDSIYEYTPSAVCKCIFILGYVV